LSLQRPKNVAKRRSTPLSEAKTTSFSTGQFAPRFAVLGRTESLSVGLEVAVVIARSRDLLNERHLKRLVAEYVRYYHEDRTHLGLDKDTPVGRPIDSQPSSDTEIQSFPRLGGLHHRYQRAA
jgi:hypothetical protein